MIQRAMDDFAGLLSDIKAEAQAGRGPGPADKHRLFSALAYQSPGDIPSGLAELTELLQLEPHDLQAQYNAYNAETAAMRAKPRKASVEFKLRSGAYENRSDSGNASRLVTKFGDRLRYCPDTNRWLIWDGTRWAVDEVDELYQYARATVADIYREAGTLSDTAERKQHASFALRSESERGLRAMMSLARTEPGIPVRRSELDAHQFKLNTANGVVDLTSGDIFPHKQDLFFTKILPWPADETMATPHWTQFLTEITGNDPGLQEYLKQIAGYCLTASVREQCFFIFWGDGRNGKSTFIKVLLEMLGSWAAQTPADTFIMKKGANNHNDLARLFDKRLVAAIETEDGGRLAEGLIKSMAGSDRIAARALYQEFFEYDPQFKVILTTNHKPRIKGTDFAIWRRIRLVPFTWRIPDDKVDPDIFDKLKAEMPGILAWAIDGCLQWQLAGKLESPEKVQEAVNEYQKDQDLVRRFTDEMCETGKSYSTSLKELYELYEKWSKDGGEFVLSKNRFSKRLIEMGMERMHEREGTQLRGIREKGNELF